MESGSTAANLLLFLFVVLIALTALYLFVFREASSERKATKRKGVSQLTERVVL